MKIFSRLLSNKRNASPTKEAFRLQVKNKGKLLPKNLPPCVNSIFDALLRRAESYPASYLVSFEFFEKTFTSLEIAVGEFTLTEGCPSIISPGDSPLLKEKTIPALGTYMIFFNSLCHEIKLLLPAGFETTNNHYHKIEVFSPSAGEPPNVSVNHQARRTGFSFHIIPPAKP